MDLGTAAPTAPPAAHPLWTALHTGILDDLERLTDVVVERLRRELPHYAAVPAGAIRAGTRENLRRATGALVDRRRPTEDELAAAGSVGEIRGRQGIPVDELLRGFRIAAQELWAEQRRRATAAGLAEADQLDAARIIWEWVDDALAPAARAHRQVELELVDRDSQQRGRLLRSLLFGPLAPADLDLLVDRYGLSPDRRYHAVRAGPLDNGIARSVRELLAPPGGAGLVDHLDAELAGVLPAPPRASVPVPVGLGPALPLAEAPLSFSDAGAALLTATAFGLPGVHTVDELGVRVPVATRPEVGRRLAARYLAPLDPDSPAGVAVLDTLGAYLAHGRRVHQTATALYVHPNTVRYRLRRFEETTGADLDRTEDVLAVWWALQHRRIDPAERGD
jgi:hypothetical protein